MSLAAKALPAVLALLSPLGCGPGEPRLDPGAGGNSSTGGAGGEPAAGGEPGPNGGGALGGADMGGNEPHGGGGSPGQADLGEVAFDLFITSAVADPWGEGGPMTPYNVNVCLSAGGTNNHVTTKNLGTAAAEPFAITATVLSTPPSFSVEVGSCTIVESASADAGESFFFNTPGCCKIVDQISTFDFIYRRKIRVTVDAQNVVDESDESNNQALSNEIDIANDAVAIGFDG
jgi:hypothetical protein